MICRAAKAGSWLLLVLVASGCGEDQDPEGRPAAAPAGAQATGPDQPLPPVTPVEAVTDWQLDTSENGTRLLYPATGEDGPVAILTCVGDRLIVRLPRVAPIGSEERLSIGSGDHVEVMVADRDRGGGASARGPIPDTLGAMLETGFGAAYGSFSTGVLPPVPDDMRARFRAACN